MSILAKLVICLAIFGFGIAGGIKWHAGQDAIEKNERLENEREVQRGNRATEKANSDNVIGAINEARKRETAAKVLANNLRTESGGLRDDLADLRKRLPSSTLDACRQYSTTLSTVFEQCAGNLESLAGKAQGHASDTLTLEQAWPKPSTSSKPTAPD